MYMCVCVCVCVCVFVCVGEAIADSGGLKFSWESFLLQHKPEALDRKLFFLAQGQTWCQKQVGYTLVVY